jgi:Rrf2 family transcriptional regulator, iron-sulfur cluster assembly transcription factor
MFRYGKLAQRAVGALSYLAEQRAVGNEPVSSAAVAAARKMPVTLAAKLLSRTASAGLTLGSTGPGGGYRLARPPQKITLAQIVDLFDRRPDDYPCPFGPGWCGKQDPCPLHDQFLAIEQRARDFLEHTTLAVFAGGPPARRDG